MDDVEAATCIIYLNREDAELKQKPLHLGTDVPSEHRRQLVVNHHHKCDPVGKLGQPFARQLQRLRVSIQSDQLGFGAGGQQGVGVAAEAKRAVDEDATTFGWWVNGRGFECRSEQRDNLRQHDGYVELGQATHPTSRPFSSLSCSQETLAALLLELRAKGA